MTKSEELAWYVELGTNIRCARKRKGLTQSTLASAAGYAVNGSSHSHLCRIELGRAEIGINCLQSIADALGVTAVSLFPAPNSHSA